MPWRSRREGDLCVPQWSQGPEQPLGVIELTGFLLKQDRARLLAFHTTPLPIARVGQNSQGSVHHIRAEQGGAGSLLFGASDVHSSSTAAAALSLASCPALWASLTPSVNYQLLMEDCA